MTSRLVRSMQNDITRVALVATEPEIVDMSDMAPYWRRNVGYGAILASKCRIWRHTGVEMSDMAPYWRRNVGYGAILASKCRIWRHTGVEMWDMAPYWRRRINVVE